MQKDFSKWHPIKQSIQDNAGRVFYREGEVRWCYLGLNIGSEADGRGERYLRPVLIIKSFNKDSMLIVPVTTKIKAGGYYRQINLGDGLARQIVLSQIRYIDAKRLKYRIGSIDPVELHKIKQAVMAVIA